MQASSAVVKQVESGDLKFDRQFGQINVTRHDAIELEVDLGFIETSLNENNRQLALEVAEELVESYASSPSLLLKILLIELREILRQKKKTSRPFLIINNIRVRLLSRLNTDGIENLLKLAGKENAGTTKIR